MGGKGKSKGKGRESYDQKSQRLEQEIAYLHRVQEGHLGSGEWWPDDRAARKSDSGKGKGRGKGSRRDRSQSRNRSRSKSRGRSTTPRRPRSKSADKPRNRSSSRQRSASAKRKQKEEEHKKEQAAKREEKQKQKEKEKEQRAGAPRQTKLCTACYFDATYATSRRCYKCKTPFSDAAAAPLAQATPTQQPATTPTGEAAVAALQKFGKAQEATKTLSFADAVNSSPPAAPSAPKSTPAAAKPDQASSTPQHMVVDLTESDAKATEDLAKQLISLKAQRTTADAQRTAFADVPHLQAAFTQHVQELDKKILAITASRQMALAPHQLGQVIAQRQFEVADALRRKTDADEKAVSRLADFDKYVETVETDFKAKLKALTDAHQAATEGFVAERKSLVADHEADITAAQQALDAANAQLLQAISAQTAQQATRQAADTNAPAAAAQAPAPAQQPVATQQQQQQQLQQQQQQQQQQLQQQQAQQAAHDATLQQAQQQLTQQLQTIQAQAAQIAAQQQSITTASQPQPINLAALKPIAPLPSPVVPSDPAVAHSLQVVRSALALLDMQDVPLAPTWGELFSGSLTWPAFCALVPHEVVAEVDPKVSKEKGPNLTDVMPRRLVGCLKAQLNDLATQDAWKQAHNATIQQIQQDASSFAEQTLQQAKRIQDRKRTTPPTDAGKSHRTNIAHPSQQKGVAEAAAATATAAAATALPFEPTQLDASQQVATSEDL